MVRNAIGWLPRWWFLTAGVCVILALVTGGVTAWRTNAAANDTACLQFVRATSRQVTYPTLLDVERNHEIELPRLSVPPLITTVAEHDPYRVRQSYTLKRIFPFPDTASVENIETGTTVELPSVVSKESVLWSHDGSRLAYYTLTGDKTYSLVLANADGSHSQTFPMPLFIRVVFFSWSPDDQYLIVGDYFYARLIRTADGHMKTISAHENYASVDEFQWSPIGHQLAYLWAQTNIPNHVILYDPDTDSTRDYVRPDEKYWWEGRLLWSPDLRYVAAVGWADALIDVVAMDGSGVSLGMVGWDSTSQATMWLPASDRLVFMTANHELLVYAAATGGYTSLVTQVYDPHLELLADKHSLIFSQRQSDASIALVKLDLRDNSRTTLIAPETKGWITRFHVLADRRRVAVSVWENGAFDVDLLDAANGKWQRLASGLSYVSIKREWSDPATLMFSWNITDETSHQTIKAGWDVYDLAGNRQAHFQGDGAAFTGIRDIEFFVPHWSPDHRYAVFTGNDPDLFKGLIVVSRDGTQAWQLDDTIWGVDIEHILWSPDSAKVAFTVNISGRAVVLVYTADGKRLARADNSLLDAYVHWTACRL